MDREFVRWKEEQRHRDAAARGVQAPSTSTPTVQSAVAVPALQAALVGIAVGILTGGLGLLFGAGLALGGKLALAGLLVGTSATTIAFVFQERAIRATPALVARAKLELAQPSPMPDPEPEPWRVIRPYGGHALPSTAGAFQQNVRAIEPDAPAHIRELHQFICDGWENGDGNLSRAACRQRGHTRATWERIIGGKRGKSGESARGILDRAGVVEKDGTGWKWRDGVSLQDVFSITDELSAYADARARMTSGRREPRDRTDRTGRDGDGGTSGRPVRQ